MPFPIQVLPWSPHIGGLSIPSTHGTYQHDSTCCPWPRLPELESKRRRQAVASVQANGSLCTISSSTRMSSLKQSLPAKQSAAQHKILHPSAFLMCFVLKCPFGLWLWVRSQGSSERWAINMWSMEMQHMKRWLQLIQLMCFRCFPRMPAMPTRICMSAPAPPLPSGTVLANCFHSPDLSFFTY